MICAVMITEELQRNCFKSLFICTLICWEQRVIKQLKVTPAIYITWLFPRISIYLKHDKITGTRDVKLTLFPIEGWRNKAVICVQRLLILVGWTHLTVITESSKIDECSVMDWTNRWSFSRRTRYVIVLWP